MRKRTLTLLLTVALGVAGAQGTTTTDSRLTNAAVTIEIGRYAGPLSSLLAAVAKAAGYDLVLDANVDALAPGVTAPAGSGAAGAPAGTPAASPGSKPIVYNFQGKPFNEVWPLLMDVYGLSYEIVRVGNQEVIRVTNSPIQRVIKLNNANALDAVNQIKLFFGTPQYSETPQRDAQGNVVGVTRTLVDVKLDSPTLRIVADSRTNSLIVRGTNREVADVERLAQEIDRSGGQATTTANPVIQSVYSVKGLTEDIVALLGAQYPNLRVTPVGRTGQLVITGPSNQIDAALQLLAQVDRPVVIASGPATVQRTFTLSNALAENVKKVLEGTVETTRANGTASGTTGGSTGTGSATTGSAGAGTATSTAPAAAAGIGVTIIADERTNSLIVRGSAGQVAQVAELIPLLDRAVPLINVQVRIQEISESAARNLGIDWTAGFGNFVTRLVGGTLTALFDATRSFAGFNLGATLNALESQGLSKSIYDGSVTLQSGQLARGQAGATERTDANAAASIKSGGRIELNIPSTSGNISKTIDYGVLLNFLSPQVAADGTISMGVRSEVSGLETAITGSTLPNLLQFTNREAQTTIRFKTGQTVLLGGLMSTTERTTTSGVPILSSIPIVGNLFKTTSTRREATQLLIVITGNVIQ